jgi:hypothetical protein
MAPTPQMPTEDAGSATGEFIRWVRDMVTDHGDRLTKIETGRTFCPHIAETEGLKTAMTDLQATCSKAVDGLALHAHSHEVSAAAREADDKRASRGIEWWKIVVPAAVALVVVVVQALVAIHNAEAAASLKSTTTELTAAVKALAVH